MPKEKYQVKTAMPGFKVDQIVDVEVDQDGIAINQFWRRRIRDAAIDGCVEKVKPESKATSKPNSKEA